jgi:predicted dehydrogenase
MKDIRFGIIGCGDVTEKKSGPAFRKVEGSELVMVMRRDAKKLESYAKRHQVDKYTTDYLALLSDPDIDAVYIATPPKWHHFYVMEAAKHKKAIYVEKPMGRSVEECQEMVDICKKYEVPLFVAYYRRGQEKFNRIKTMIEEGDIGEIRSFHFAYTGIAGLKTQKILAALEKEL